MMHKTCINLFVLETKRLLEKLLQIKRYSIFSLYNNKPVVNLKNNCYKFKNKLKSLNKKIVKNSKIKFLDKKLLKIQK